MTKFIVKSGGEFLFPLFGDVSWTSDETQAGHFLSIEEARATMEGMEWFDNYEILPIEVN